MTGQIGDRLHVGGVLAPNVPLVWGEAWPLLARAAQEGEREDDVCELLATGHAQLWGAWAYGGAESWGMRASEHLERGRPRPLEAESEHEEQGGRGCPRSKPVMLGAVLTQVTTDWPCVTIPLLGGRKLHRWVAPLWSLIRVWARAQGCRAVVIAGRPGWRRLLGFRLAGRTASHRDLRVYPLED